MSVPVALLKVIGKGVLNAVGGGVVGDVLFDALPEVAHEVWAWWKKDRTPEQQREDVEALAKAPPAEVREAVKEVVAELAADKPAELQFDLERYLTQVPAAIRQSLRAIALCGRNGALQLIPDLFADRPVDRCVGAIRLAFHHGCARIRGGAN